MLVKSDRDDLQQASENKQSPHQKDRVPSAKRAGIIIKKVAHVPGGLSSIEIG